VVIVLKKKKRFGKLIFTTLCIGADIKNKVLAKLNPAVLRVNILFCMGAFNIQF